MMLYRFDNRMVSKNHWTEIYVIITVTTMLYEEVRKVKKNGFFFFTLKQFLFISEDTA